MTPSAPLSTSIMEAALAADGITVRYGGVTAVDGASLQVASHSVTGLIGPNGAGKTTLIDVLSGFVVPDTGGVTLGDQRLDGLKPHRRARLGLSRTFQQLELFTDLTVRENITAALRSTGPARERSFDRAVEALDLGADLERTVAELPQGRRKLVALARAVASDPVVILLDEPAAGLDPEESAAVSDYITQLSSEGVGILLVDHDMSFVLSICHRIVVLNFGAVLAEGTPAEIRRDPDVIAAYLGAS